MSHRTFSRLRTAVDRLHQSSRRRNLQQSFRRRYLHPTIEGLEPRLMLAGDLPDIISVGRVLSAWTKPDIKNNELTITYSVYNQQASEVTGTLLTTKLESGVTFKTATQLPDRNGQELAWSLGTIPAYGRASVEVTVGLATATPLQIDDGAHAFGTVDAAAVTDAAPAAKLRTDVIAPNLLASTPDANTTDPFIQAKAAELDYDPTRIFQFLTQDIGYESYVGSLRGARGTLWSSAGNALDEASLGIALFRSSGIPAQYVQGTLSDSLSQQLILSMFPASFQTVGYIPPGTQTSDPAHDPKLLAETKQHYWIQFDTGSGMNNADPTFANATIGQTFTTSQGAFSEVAKSLRHKVELKLDAELYSQAGALFGLGSGLSTTTVLDHTFNSVDLVGRPITVGQFVSQSTIGALVFSSSTTTYSPYLLVTDEALSSNEQAEPIRGSDFQEVQTNFPLGTQVLTGYFLQLTLTGGGGPATTFDRALLDRIGYSARSGLVSTAVSVDPNGPPALTPLDLFTINLLPAEQSKVAAQQAGGYANQLTAEVAASNNPPIASETQAFAAIAVSKLAGFAVVSDEEAANLASGYSVAAYPDAPRISMLTSRITVDNGSASVTFNMDLIRDGVRVVGSPGQSLTAERSYAASRGIFDSFLEAESLPMPPDSVDMSAITVLQQSSAQGIPFVTLGPNDLTQAEALDLPSDALARITDDLRAGLTVSVPTLPTTISGHVVTAWWALNTTTGETIARGQDGSNQGLTEYQVGLLITGAITGAALNVVFSPYLEGQNWKDLPPSVNLKNAIIGAFAGALIPFSFLGFFGGLALSYDFSPWGPLAKFDPPVSQLFVNLDLPNPTTPGHRAGSSQIIPASATIAAGPVVGTVRNNNTQLAGTVAANWSASGTNSFHLSALSVTSGTVAHAPGNTIGFGSIALTAVAQAMMSGNIQYSLSGIGSLSTYSDAETALGVSGNWDNYTANLDGDITLTITTDSLMLNGTQLPLGTYTIITNAAILTGSGNTASPTFAGSASVTINNGTVNLGPGTGLLSVGGSSLDPSTGTTLTGYTGSVNITASGGTDPDKVTLNGNANNVIRVSPPSGLNADQNTPVTFQASINTSLADTYTIAVEAPIGWFVLTDASGNITVTPAPGCLAGSYPIQILAESATHPDLIAQTTVQVAVNATAPGLNFSVNPDSIFTVPYLGAQVPSAFQASLKNLGPAADTYNLTFNNLPSTFHVLNSGTTVNVPAGQTGILGLYLEPTAGTLLPAPGTAITFDVTATSMTDPSITQVRTVSFTVPEIRAVTAASKPKSISTVPGLSVNASLDLNAVGNVQETVELTLTDPDGITVAGLPTTVSLNPGQTLSIPITVSAASTVPLNSNLTISILAKFGSNPFTEQITVVIPVRVVVPGADAIATAATAAADLGNTDLANRLNDLSVALTNLVQSPASEVFKKQAIAALDAVNGLLANNQFVTSSVSTLQADRAALDAAVSAGQVQSAVVTLGNHLKTVGKTLADEAKYKFTLSLVESSKTGAPQVPTTYQVVLQNTGSQPTTYDLSLLGLIGGATGSVSPSSITLQPGQVSPGSQGVPDIVVSVTSNLTTQISPLSFQVNAAVHNASEITKTVTGQFIPRAELLKVVSVEATPPFTNPGGMVEIKANILNAVNRQQTANVSYTVADVQGKIVFSLPKPVPVTLNVLTTLTSVDLGQFDTTGLAKGTYAINVSVNGAVGTGSLLVGTPVTTTLSTTPTTAPSGTVTVTNTLQIDSQMPLGLPFGLIGQLSEGGTTGVAVNGNFAYVGTSAGIHVINVTDPKHPTDLLTFGGSDIPGGSTVQMQVYKDNLVVLAKLDNTPSKLLVYSLADPNTPSLLGQTGLAINGANLTGLTLSLDAIANDLVFISAFWYRYFIFGGQILGQFGQSIVIDISNPALPTVKSVVYNEPADPTHVYADGNTFPDGSSNIWQVVSAGSQTELVATTTATRDVYSGPTVKGIVMVVDKSNPTAPVVLQKLEIPGMAVVTSISVQGNRAFIVGSTEYWGGGTVGLVGNIVTGTLDLTNPQAPTVISTHATSVSANGLGNALNLGNNHYVTSSIARPSTSTALLFFDASDPNNVVVTQQIVPAAVNYAATQNGLLFTVDGSNLLIYSLATTQLNIPVTASVQVPKNTDVAIVANSFNVPPTQIISGTTFDTLVWNTSLTGASPSQTFTWQSTVNFLQPAEARAVDLGGTVDFTSQGTSASLPLAAQFVSGEQIIGLSPTKRTNAPGAVANYTLTLKNPTADTLTYETTVQGVPASWVNIPFQTNVPAGGTVTVPLTLTSDIFASLADYKFSVTARTSAGAFGFVEGDIVLQGQPPQPDPQSHAVSVALTPVQATTGQGTAANYVARVTNAGSASETFQLSLVGLPAGFTATFGNTSVDVPPGSSNFRDVPLTIVPTAGTKADTYAFQVLAQSASTPNVSDQTSGQVTVVAIGVNVALTPKSNTPGGTLQMKVTNTGQVAETFDLSLSAPVALVATLGVKSVTLDPGKSQTVPINVGAIDFATQGSLTLIGTATSRTNSAVQSSDSSQVAIAGTLRMTAAFDKATQTIPKPGPASFLLMVDNLGNLEDQYTASIVSSRGPVTAALMDLNGQPAQTIPLFVLPGLSKGALLLDTNLTGIGQGVVTVQIRSRTDNKIMAEATATLKTETQTSLAILAASADKNEGNSGFTPFTFTVTRTGNIGGTTSVGYTVSGSGMNPADAADFGGAFPSGQVTFAANEMSKTITINVLGDTINEPDNQFTVKLANASNGAVIATSTALGTIRNDDVASGFRLTCSALHVGLNTCTILGATPYGVADLVLGIHPGNRTLAQYHVTLGMLDPTIVAQGIVQPDGHAVVQFTIATEELLQQVLLEAFEQVPKPRTSNIVIVGAPLMATNGNGTNTTSLNASALPSLLNAAIARWNAAGLSTIEANLLNSVRVDVIDLPAGMLGRAVDNRIYVDTSADGHGWFVDPTPADNTEFQVAVGKTQLNAPTSSPALGRMDLLTVMLHELGHVLGRSDEPVGSPHTLMIGQLPESTRRLPDAISTVAPTILSPLDVNHDGRVSPIDALMVINQLNLRTTLTSPSVRSSAMDVNGDGRVTPLDALMVINYLNRPKNSGGEGEGPSLSGPSRSSRDRTNSVPQDSLDEILLMALAADVMKSKKGALSFCD